MIVGTVSDLDVLRMDLEPFWYAIKSAKKPDLLLFAGDMYDFHMPENYETIIKFLDKAKWNCPIVGVFGNKVFDEDLEIIERATKGRITFLDNEIKTFEIKGEKIGIVGSRGVLDAPVWFVFGNIPDVKNISEDESKELEKLLNSLECDTKVLLTHYSPTYKTLDGERKGLYTSLGSEKMEKVLVKTKTSFAIHGHAHYGRPLAFVKKIPVFNACFSINRNIVMIDTKNLPKPGDK